jgi:hypothetical protein
MLFPSTGFTWTTFWSKEARLTSGTRMTVPLICAASRVRISFSTAMIDAYSVPWAPDTMARTGPGRTPCTTATGMLVAASTPAGTSMNPVAVWPRAARAVPTAKVASEARRERRPAATESSIMGASMIWAGVYNRTDAGVVARRRLARPLPPVASGP